MSYNRNKSKKTWIIIAVIAAVVGVIVYLKRKGKLHFGQPVQIKK